MPVALAAGMKTKHHEPNPAPTQFENIETTDLDAVVGGCACGCGSAACGCATGGSCVGAAAAPARRPFFFGRR